MPEIIRGISESSLFAPDGNSLGGVINRWTLERYRRGSVGAANPY